MARVQPPFIVTASNGDVVSGATVRIQIQGTTTDAVVYVDATAGTTMGNPVTTDAQGRIPGWLDEGKYLFTVSGGTPAITTYTRVMWLTEPGSIIGTSRLADASVTGAKIADGAVSTAKLADASVSTAKIQDASVTAAKLAAGAIPAVGVLGSANIGDGSITTAKLADGSVTTAKIVDAAVTVAKLATDSVTSIKIATGAVATDELANASVTAAKLAPGAVPGVPFGSIVAYGGHFPPTGWLICDGRGYMADALPALYAAIGAAYGYGASYSPSDLNIVNPVLGQPWFRIPDLVGRLPLGKGNPTGITDLGQNEGRTHLERGIKHRHGLGSLSLTAAGSHQHLLDYGLTSSGTLNELPNPAAWSRSASPITTTSIGVAPAGSHTHAVSGEIGYRTDPISNSPTPLDSPAFLVVNFIIRASE